MRLFLIENIASPDFTEKVNIAHSSYAKNNKISIFKQWIESINKHHSRFIVIFAVTN